MLLTLKSSEKSSWRGLRPDLDSNTPSDPAQVKNGMCETERLGFGGFSPRHFRAEFLPQAASTRWPRAASLGLVVNRRKKEKNCWFRPIRFDQRGSWVE
ncbi:hypothetical protein E5288_WYG022219 [Bos mutus]|uniref:Uncharacterized protein n=1 Tax=Bos mutus TaxID=72004 RepID=A0A6B0SA98_9CETA|nr:hypothetical protein [Bos mutus]